jgi:hypothetical protein
LLAVKLRSSLLFVLSSLLPHFIIIIQSQNREGANSNSKDDDWGNSKRKRTTVNSILDTCFNI